MNSKIQKELDNLYNETKLASGTERTKINAICNTICDDVNFLSEVGNSIITVIEKDGFNIESNLGALLSCIINVITHVGFYKSVSEERIKYVLYCALLCVLFKNHPNILAKVEINRLRTLYLECYELVVLIPNTVKIAKQGCISCIGSSFKLFNRLNKGKILI